MSSEAMIIFTRTYDFVSWLIPRSMDFPRSQRFVVTARLQAAALDFQEQIVEANKLWGRARLERLRQADATLHKIKIYLRLVWRWEWLSVGQYYHASGMVKEIGNLLGGWIKQTMEACGMSRPAKPTDKLPDKPDSGTPKPSEAKGQADGLFVRGPVRDHYFVLCVARSWGSTHDNARCAQRNRNNPNNRNDNNGFRLVVSHIFL